MRALACIASIIGGACWVGSAVLSGDAARGADTAGIVLLSVAAALVGFRLTTGPLVWLRAIVGAGCVALSWSLVAAARAEASTDVVNGVAGAGALLLGLFFLVRRPARADRPDGPPRPSRSHGTHSK